MATMAYGDGTLIERKSGPRKGEWVKRFKTADGSWHATSWKSKPTRAMVQARIAELSRTSPPQTESESVGAYLARWLRDGTTHLRGRTVIEYRRLARDIDARFGPVRLVDLSTPDIQRWVNDGATRHHLAVLRSALSQAVRWGLIPVNPARAARPLREERREMRALSLEETKRLLAQVKGDPLLTLAIFTGMRQGEILGLRWSDVDLRRGQLRVNASLWWKPGPDGRVPVLTEPKTKRSARALSLPPVVTAALTELRRTQGFGSKDGLVFVRPNGIALEPTSAYSSLQRHLAAAGLPKVPFHALRHSAASLLIASGMPIPEVSAYLGHSNVATTLSIYAHAAESSQQAIANRMAELLAEPVSETAADTG